MSRSVKPPPEHAYLTIIVPVELRKQLQHLAIDRGETMRDFVTRAIQSEIRKIQQETW